MTMKSANEPADSRGAQETHAMGAAKEQETKALKSALGISGDYVAGSAFDRELQQRRKEERQAQRDAEAFARDVDVPGLCSQANRA